MVRSGRFAKRAAEKSCSSWRCTAAVREDIFDPKNLFAATAGALPNVSGAAEAVSPIGIDRWARETVDAKGAGVALVTTAAAWMSHQSPNHHFGMFPCEAGVHFFLFLELTRAGRGSRV